jgi:hypothetical protein
MGGGSANTGGIGAFNFAPRIELNGNLDSG